MQDMKLEAAAKAKELKVNPRSIKEWQALGDGDLSKIRRLGPNEPTQTSPAIAQSATVTGKLKAGKGSARSDRISLNSSAEDESNQEMDEDDEDDSCARGAASPAKAAKSSIIHQVRRGSSDTRVSLAPKNSASSAN